MNPSEYIQVKYPLLHYPGFSITHSIYLVTAVAQLYWTAWIVRGKYCLWVCKRTTYLTENKLVSSVHCLWIGQKEIMYFSILTLSNDAVWAVKNLDNLKLKAGDIQMELLLFLECFTPMSKLFQKNLHLAGNKDIQTSWSQFLIWSY